MWRSRNPTGQRGFGTSVSEQISFRGSEEVWWKPVSDKRHFRQKKRRHETGQDMLETGQRRFLQKAWRKGAEFTCVLCCRQLLKQRHISAAHTSHSVRPGMLFISAPSLPEGADILMKWQDADRWRKIPKWRLMSSVTAYRKVRLQSAYLF